MSESWRRYVTTMCSDAWDLDHVATQSVVERIEALIVSDRLADSTVAEVLTDVGVSRFAADLVATSIRVMVEA